MFLRHGAGIAPILRVGGHAATAFPAESMAASRARCSAPSGGALASARLIASSSSAACRSRRAASRVGSSSDLERVRDA
ncbi:conserved hypothetical protein [Actinomyces sp. oral taxon 180 str. F0310]|nr:conserved hypothetical protein [Actinomyces sp. oral taxon 180 str. F0310]